MAPSVSVLTGFHFITLKLGKFTQFEELYAMFMSTFKTKWGGNVYSSPYELKKPLQIRGKIVIYM